MGQPVIESGTLGVLAPDSIGYVAVSPDAAAMCAHCCYFLAGEQSLCQKVKGEIAPGGWCQLYESDSEMATPMDMAPESTPVIVPESATPAKPALTTVLIEAADLSRARPDPEQRVIHNVRLIKTGKSVNRRRYDGPVLEKAAPLFEGVKSYSNHPTPTDQRDRPERSVRDITGWFTDVQYRKDGLYATRHFTRTQAGQDSWALAEDIIAGRAPASLLELSINAVGKGRVDASEKDGTYIVESIDRVHSVDDVTTGAAGGSLMPLVAGANDDLATLLLKSLSFDEWTEAQPAFVERLKSQWKQVRLDEATRTALAEADSRVKTAEAATGTARQALLEAQELITRLTSNSEAVLTQLRDTTRLLALERALAAVTLPASYKNDLRKRLPELAESEWMGVITTELSKAKRNGDYPPRVGVTGAGAQVSEAVRETYTPDSIAPRDDENATQWAARMALLNQRRN